MAKLSNFNSSNSQKNVNEKSLQEAYDKYKDLPQSELFSTLMTEVAKQKENGTFDFNALENMVNGMQNTMPKENFENIKRILNRLK